MGMLRLLSTLSSREVSWCGPCSGCLPPSVCSSGPHSRPTKRGQPSTIRSSFPVPPWFAGEYGLDGTKCARSIRRCNCSWSIQCSLMSCPLCLLSHRCMSIIMYVNQFLRIYERFIGSSPCVCLMIRASPVLWLCPMDHSVSYHCSL